jgi:hypothetical protein
MPWRGEWSGKDKVITQDNIAASKVRVEAIKAAKEGRATPDQMQLLADCDKVMQEAMKTRS